MRRVLVTGSRNLQDGEPVWEALAKQAEEHGPIVVVHGDCPTGADAAATTWAMSTNYPAYLETHPADWSIGKKAGPLRNQEMVDLGADVCLAFPEFGSRGTRDCMRRAEAAGIPLIVHHPKSWPSSGVLFEGREPSE